MIIGADVLIKYIPEGDEINAYFSFSDYIEEKEEDSFGVTDYKIFYNCENGEDELKELMKNNVDFKVLSYELVEITE